MSLKSLKQVMLAKVEIVYGTDAIPTNVANAILVANVKHTPMVQDLPARNPIRPYFSNDGVIPAGAHVTLDFDIEVAGSGAAGTAPAWGAVLQACAMAETINAGVSAVYSPISSGEKSVTLYYNVDGKQHSITGARGSFSMKFAKGGIPMLSFKFIGLYNTPTDTALPVPTLAGWTKPIPVNLANTTPVTLHGYAGAFSDINLDIANANTYRNLIGSESILFHDRKPKGSCVMEMPAIATKNFYSIAAAGTTGALALTHGTIAGNKVAIACPTVQVTNPVHSSADNIEMLGLTLELQPNTGNDELVITVT
jgi:hypothetical protein